MSEEKEFRCAGSYLTGTACGNVDLPEGVVCTRCQAKEFGPEEKEKAIEAEKERTKNLPPDRVKKDSHKRETVVVIKEEKQKEETPKEEKIK